MSMPAIAQAQMLADELGRAAGRYRSLRSCAVVGCAGGNGLELLTAVPRVVAIDINGDYLEAVRARYATMLPGLELHAANIEDGRPTGCAPVDLVFAGLILEYVDLAAAATSFRALCRAGGVLVVILQKQSLEVPPVSSSPYSSLQSLERVMTLHDPEFVRSRLEAADFVLGSWRERALASGKRFTVMNFAG